MKNFMFLMVLSSFLFAKEVEDSFTDFLVGNYLLIGKQVDSDSTYAGKVSIFKKDQKLMVKREIASKIVLGTGSIEKALNGEMDVLRIRFSAEDKNYEETCLISSDLDNYARISCYLYFPNVATNFPGFEALYHDHTAD